MVKRKQVAERTQSQFDAIKTIEESKNFFWYYAGATLLFTLILFWKFVFSAANEMLFSSDTIQAGFFWRSYMTEHFKSIGALLPLSPQLWNPFIFGGLPTVDAFHGDIFYLPTYFLKEWFGPSEIYKAFGWGMVLHVYLAGLTSYLCARGFGLSRLASAFAGISYMFSGYLVSLVAPGHDGKMYVTALFPLAFHFLNRGFVTSQLKHFFALAITIAFIILTPHPQMAYFSLMALGFYALFQIIMMLKEKRGVAKTGIVAALFIMAIVVGLAGSAIQMYPSYKYITEFSPRAGEGAEGRSGYEWATSWSMHLEEAVGVVVPLFHGVDDGRDEGGYWGRNQFKDNTEYAGFFPVFLGIIGLVLWRERRTWFLLGLGLFALIYALGDTTPIFRLFYALLPGVKKMRAPSMIMFLFSFSFCMLAAFGIDAIQKLRSEKKPALTENLNKWLLIFAGVLTLKALLITVAGSSLLNLYTSIFYSGISAAPPDNNVQTMLGTLGTIQMSLWLIAILCWAAVFLIRGLSRGTMGRIAIVGLIFLSLVDLWRVDLRFIQIAPYNQYIPQTMPVLQRLKQESEPYRVMDFSRRSFSSKNYLAMNGVEQMVGYHGAQLKTYDEFVGGLTFKNLFNGQSLNLRPFQLAGTKYIILDRGTAFPESEGVTKAYDNEVTMFQVPDVMRRATIFHEYVLGTQDKSDLDNLLSPEFAFREKVILYEEPEYRPALSPASTQEAVEIVRHEIARQVYRVTLNSPGILFISENYFPAWHAKVDGVEKKVLKADHTFRAVSLDAGTHEVEFYYQWPRYETGKWLSIAAFLVSGAGLIVCAFYERRKKGAEA